MDYQTPERMALKKRAIPLPDLRGKTVLDVGCDHGWWCWDAADLGASDCLGLDRNRRVRGNLCDLITRNEHVARVARLPCRFQKIDLGRQWLEYGKFDVVFCFSMYHHVYANCGDHNAVWFWLWRHTKGELLWEGALSTDDPVVRMHVTHPYHRDDILKAAERYFNLEYVGPALHVKTREVWRCRPRALAPRQLQAKTCKGSGGAAAAFTYYSGRRIGEISEILGFDAFPGSLNCRTTPDFDWEHDYYRARLLDVVDRHSGLDGDWGYRWARFYPLVMDDDFTGAFAFRFEGESYDANYVEIIAGTRLRDILPETFVIHG